MVRTDHALHTECCGPSTIASGKWPHLPRGSRTDRFAEDASCLDLQALVMPGARESTLLCDVGQTSSSPAIAPLPHLSVSTSDLDLREMPRASEWLGHQLESRANLGPGRRPWRRTRALPRVLRPRLKTPAAVGGSSSMKDLVRRRTAQRRVRPDIVVPVLEPH